MADVRPFRAYRYDLGRVGALADVVTPPYDVIDPAMQDALYARSPYNFVRVDLNRPEPADSDTNNRYTRAAGFLRDWRQSGILRRDSARSFYVYHQVFEHAGQQYTRRGVLARVRLEPFGEGRIFPHEETMSGPKADRLALFRPTRMNLSPVFGLYPDEAGEVQGLLDRAIERQLPIEATDDNGVVNRLWPVADQHVTSAVTGLLGPKPIFIADGHHRYETALRYLEERRTAGEATDSESPANFVLMTLVRMNDQGLVVFPTHRLMSGIQDMSADQVRTALRGDFDVQTVGTGVDAGRHAWETIEVEESQNLLALGTAADGIWQLARYNARTLPEQLAPGHGAAWRGLGVSILHTAVVGKDLAQIMQGQAQFTYVHSLAEVERAMSRKECQLAVLVPPATTGHVQEIAGSGEKMPPKSTYFYPKLLSGLVLNPLNET